LKHHSKRIFARRQGDKAEEMYFIERGEIAIMKDDEKTVLRTLKAGEHFGEVSLTGSNSWPTRAPPVSALCMLKTKSS